MDRINVDEEEVHKFSSMAEEWWNSDGKFGPLHKINHLRLHYVDGIAQLSGKDVLDVGCGGGILAEAMASFGAAVPGVDMGQASLEVARAHSRDSGVEISYQLVDVEDLAKEKQDAFDVVTCMELLEHVPDPASMVVACAKLAKPGGHVFFSTINRNPKSFLFAIIGAEYLLGLIPKGTHDYARFIKPSELARWARTGHLHIDDITGLSYNPLTGRYWLGSDIDVNYMAHAERYKAQPS